MALTLVELALIVAIAIIAALVLLCIQLKRQVRKLRLDQTELSYFGKVVPRQFIEHISKHGSEELELGRADEDEVAILFVDIRGFTGLSEIMSPQELLNFLNSYFVRMNQPIHKNNGFIDKFIGDAIMALFDNPNGSMQSRATDALNAAYELRQALCLYNQHRANSTYTAIDIGIGIHFGPVVIGTVGSSDRMDTTVIGDSVNIAQRLESLAPIYQVDIVVSDAMINTANTSQHEYRLIDWVKLKGRIEAIKIYEILTHLDEQEKVIRQKVADLIKRGIDARIARNTSAATALFEQAKQINPNDPIVAHHLHICAQIMAQQTVIDWHGATIA